MRNLKHMKEKQLCIIVIVGHLLQPDVKYDNIKILLILLVLLFSKV